MITSNIEALLFAAGKPVAFTLLAKTLNVSLEVVKESVADIEKRFNVSSSGIHLINQDGKAQFVTNADHAELVSSMQKQEISGELTRPQLETLTIIAYRCPITKPEIEQIRGINCSLILRNLLMRGLIEEQEGGQNFEPKYIVTHDFLKYLGLHNVQELPEYQTLNQDEEMAGLLTTSPDEKSKE